LPGAKWRKRLSDLKLARLFKLSHDTGIKYFSINTPDSNPDDGYFDTYDTYLDETTGKKRVDADFIRSPFPQGRILSLSKREWKSLRREYSRENFRYSLYFQNDFSNPIESSMIHQDGDPFMNLRIIENMRNDEMPFAPTQFFRDKKGSDPYDLPDRAMSFFLSGPGKSFSEKIPLTNLTLSWHPKFAAWHRGTGGVETTRAFTTITLPLGLLFLTEPEV
jgi:hypothetical protein